MAQATPPQKIATGIEMKKIKAKGEPQNKG